MARFSWLASLLGRSKSSSVTLPSVPLKATPERLYNGRTAAELKEQWALSAKNLQILITPEANEYIHTNLENPGVLQIVGKVMNFGNSQSYRFAKLLSEKHGCARAQGSDSWGALSYCHKVVEEKVVLFVPLPHERRSEMNDKFFDNEFARAIEFNFS